MPPASILIVGGDSQIGQCLYTRLTSLGLKVNRTTRRKTKQDNTDLQLDLGNPGEFKPSQKFDLAFICAGVTNISKCEEYPEETAEINAHNTIKVIEQLSAQGTFIVYFSSNVVFSGDTAKPRTDALTNPICNYGKQKQSVEKHLLQSNHDFSIIRLTKVIGDKFALLDNWAKSLLNTTSIRAFSDLKMAPVSMESLMDVCTKIAAKPRAGVFHLSGPEDVTYAQAATYMASQLSVPGELVHHQTSKEAGVQIAFKPKNTTLDVQSSETYLDFVPEHWTSIIDQFLKSRQARETRGDHPLKQAG